MEKFFVVGLGGSGGKTLQFLMNTLTQELQRLGWYDPLPSCWQFVHVDLPPQPDGIGPEFPPTVPEQGGSYLRVVTPHDSYASLDVTLEQRLANWPSGSALRALAAWRPPSSQVNQQLQYGAGQYRAIGRLATLAHAPEIFNGLRAAAERVIDHQAVTAQQRIATLLDVAPASSDSPPMVLVVSSLAGGTGASMTLDVCNLLRAIPSFPGDDSIALLYTPEVFAELQDYERAGVDANALATMAELLAAMGRHGLNWTDEEWSVYGGAGSTPKTKGRGPLRVIPIGAKSAGVPFGDGRSRTVYEGTARALAAMMMSPVQTSNFRAYTHGNFSSTMSAVGDRFGLDTEPGGGQAQIYGFLSIGFGSVGLGRDRYAEYAAQRLARGAVDRLLTGYRDDRIGRGLITEGQALQERADLSYRDFIRWTGLPPVRNLEADAPAFRQIADSLWATADQQALSAQLVQEMVAPLNGVEGTGSYFASAISSASQNNEQRVTATTSERLLAASERWVPVTQAAVERATLRVLSEYGVAVAVRVLEQFRADLLSSASVIRTARWSAQTMAAMQGDFQALAAVKQQIRRAFAQVESLVGRLRAHYFSYAQDRVARSLADLLTQLANDMVQPLADSLSDAEKGLDRDRRMSADGRVTTVVRTDVVPLWPTDAPVPARFGTATNEVLLEDINSYRAMFDRHVAEDTDTVVGAAADAFGIAVQQVIALVDAPNRTDDELRAIRGLDGLVAIDGIEVPVRLGRTRGWWPNTLPSRPPSVPAYQPALKPAQLLESARLWVGRTNTSFGRFIGEGLRSHLTDESIGSQVLHDRQTAFLEKFGTALRLARPLANYDQTQLNALHNPAALELSIQLSEIPLAGSGALEERVRQLLYGLEHVNTRHLEDNIGAAMTDNRSRNRIDIIGAAAPVSPLALSSLQLPIRERWQASLSSENMRQSFWQWRRGRALTEFVPVLDGWLRAMVLGWMIGRLAGDISIPKESKLQSARVYDEDARAWQSFPNPLLGIRHQRELDAWTLLAAVLESMPLAIANCSGDPQFTDLLPYRTLRRIGELSDRTTNRALESWLADGVGLGGSPNTFLSLPDTAGSGERLAGAQEWVTTVDQQFRTLLPPTDLTLYLPGGDLAVLTPHNFDRIKAPSSWELAPVIVTASQALIEQLADPAYQNRTGFVEPIG
ncbi:MAG: tubulin-like doman-containing protein [Jatrophihabitantaceae bacterium]